jgi:hypothetical protein
VRPLYVAVCGPAVASERETKVATEVGRLLAAAGAVVVTGGLGGVMGAASRGAHDAGGTVIGILPGDRRDAANPHCTVTVPTGMGEGRNVLVVRAADALIAIGGEYGTLSEIALALKLGVPVVGVATWELSKHGAVAHFRSVRTAHEAVTTAVTAAKTHRAN